MSQVTNQIFYATLYHPIQAGSIDGTDTAPHDNAVYRALLASSTGLYDPTGDPKAEGDPYCTLFVGRLARHTTEETLKLIMSKFGKVKHIRVVRHIVTGASQGYAFVEFETEKEMLLAYEMAHYNVVDGSQIIVDYNRQQLMPGWIPRRLGGGLGGRKESGQLRFGGRDRPFRAPLRPIPQEQLTKLGIPLPPVGRYMSRFLIPPVPRRPDSSKETPHRHRTSQNDVLREAPHLESTSGDRRVTDRVSSRSPERRLKGGERSVDGIKPSSSSRHKRERHSVDDDRYSDHYNKRVRKHDSEKSRMDGKDYPSEAVDEKDYHERFETLEGEKLHRERRHNSLEAADERDHHGQRYDDSGEHELRSTGYEGRRKSEYGQKGREGRRSSNRETADDEKRSAGYEINMSKHRHERRERKRSRSRESADNEIKSSGYEQGRKKSRHEEGKHERREYNRSHSKHRNRET